MKKITLPIYAIICSLVGALFLPLVSSYLISQASQTVIEVTSSDNAGAGTLRDAIETAFTINESDTLITFGEDVSVITLTSNLPPFQSEDFAITIDGESGVIVTTDGSFTGPALQIGTSAINSTNNIIKNIMFSGFTNGIAIYGDNNRVEDVSVVGAMDGEDCIGEVGIAVGLRAGTTSAVGNYIANNSITCFRKGVLVLESDGTVIFNNTIRENISDVSTTLIDDANTCYAAGIEIQGAVNGGETSASALIANNIVELNGLAFDEDNAALCPEATFLSAGIIITDNSDGDAVEYVHIKNNQVSENYGSGVVLQHARFSLVRDNHIYQNGVGASDDDNDSGNGISLVCTSGDKGLLDGLNDGSRANLIFRNTIYANADNGVYVGPSCVDDNDDVQAGSNINNVIVENSIYSNGRTGSGSHLAADGIGIDLASDDDISAGAYSSGNPFITENDEGDDDTGGNNVQNAPVITSTVYDTVLGEWEVEGTVDLDTGSGAIVELYQVDCSGDANAFDITNCDADANDEAENLGFGEGRKFLVRVALAVDREDNNWSVNIPSSVGFNGGLLTSTLTTGASEDTTCYKALVLVDSGLEDAPVRFCDTSEFGANFRAQYTYNTGAFNAFVAQPTISQGYTQSFIVRFANTGNLPFEDMVFTADLAPDLTYVENTCTLALDVDGADEFSCHLGTGGEIIMDDDQTLPLGVGETYIVRFNVLVAEDADLGAVSNTMSVTIIDPDGVDIPDVVVPFTIVAADVEEGQSSLLVCTDEDAADTQPVATFTINSVAHTNSVFTTTPGTAVFRSSSPTAGNSEFLWQWRLDNALVATGSGATNPAQNITLTSGTHTVSHMVTDCDGDIHVDAVSLNVITGSSTVSATLTKSMTPVSGLENGDLVTVDIAVKNTSATQSITALTLDDELGGLNTTIPVCNFSLEFIPTSSSTACSINTSGRMVLALSSTPILPGKILNIRYLATVSGGIGSYTNELSYVSSTPTLSATPTVASTTHTIVAASQACSGSATVDAEFTINNQPTSGSTIAASGPGSFVFTNTSTTGDGTITYHWFVNNVLQASATTNTITRTLSANTTVTLLKSDCNGSNDSDSVTVTFSTSGGTAGPFTLVKRTADGKDAYALSVGTVSYEVAITNTDTAAAHVYSLVDVIPDAFLASVSVTDPAGGTNASTGRQVVVNNITIAAGVTQVVKYTLTLEDKDDFPLDEYDLNASAKKTADDLYADSISEASVTVTGNSYAKTSNILGAPDKKFLSLSEDGEVIIEFEAEKAVVDGRGDDFALFLIDNHADDVDKDGEERRVSVSQDGERYVRVSSSNNGYDISKTNLSWIKFIKIEDRSDPISGRAPGTDIDAVCMLNIGVPVAAAAQVTSGSVTQSASNQVYIDVTKAFDNPLKKSDCTEDLVAVASALPPALVPPPVTKDARTIELPAPPLPFPVTQLPKTGPAMAVSSGLLGLVVYFTRRFFQ